MRPAQQGPRLIRRRLCRSGLARLKQSLLAATPLTQIEISPTEPGSNTRTIFERCPAATSSISALTPRIPREYDVYVRSATITPRAGKARADSGDIAAQTGSTATPTQNPALMAMSTNPRTAPHTQ